MRENNEQMVVASLLCDGKVWVSHDDSLLLRQSALGLFNEVGAQIQAMLGEEDFGIDLNQEESGVLFTLKVGDVANEPPNFSPPEPRWL